MIEKILGLFSGGYAKVIVYLVAAAAIVAAVWFAYLWVYDKGHAQGVLDQVAVDKPVIDKFNQEVIQRNQKIADLEEKSQEYGAQLQSLQKQLDTSAQDAIDAYVKAHPQSKVVPKPGQCVNGISSDAASAYNAYIRSITK